MGKNDSEEINAMLREVVALTRESKIILRSHRLIFAAMMRVLPSDQAETVKEALRSLSGDPSIPSEDSEAARHALDLVDSRTSFSVSDKADTGALRLIPGGKEDA